MNSNPPIIPINNKLPVKTQTKKAVMIVAEILKVIVFAIPLFLVGMFVEEGVGY
jgi:hypothetical protein